MNDPATPPPAAILQSDHSCITCRYNLRGQPRDGRCPECATPVVFSTGQDLPLVMRPAEETFIQTSLTCVHCGGEVCGRTTWQSCSSCGTPAWHSIYGDWLRASDPRWLHVTDRGVVCWLWSVVVTTLLIASAVALGVVEFAILARSGRDNTTDDDLALTAFAVVVPLLSAAGYAFSAFVVTIRRPRAWPQRVRRCRSTLRIAAILSLAGSIVTLVTLGPDSSDGVAIARWILSLPAIVTLVALNVYLAHLARLIPNRQWARQFLALAWVGGVVSILGSPFQYSGTIPEPATNPVVKAVDAWGVVTGEFVCALGPALGLIAVWQIVLLLVMHAELRRAARQLERDLSLAAQ